MKKLEDFYNNNYKTTNMLEWSQLTERQKIALMHSREYRKFELDAAFDGFKLACILECNKLIELVQRVTSIK